MKAKTTMDLETENLLLRQQLAESQEMIQAIRSGSVDAFVADNGQIYTLQSADYVYRVLVDTMNQGAVTLGLDGGILYVNREFSRLMGLPTDGLIGSDFQQLLSTPDQALFKTLLHCSQETPGRESLTLRTSAGQMIPVLMSMSSLVPFGIQAVSVLITDLTERRSNEHTALIRKRLELSQSAGQVGTFDWDLHTGVVVWTKELEQLFGLPVGGFDGTYQCWAQRVHPDDLAHAEAQISEAITGNRPFSVEYRIVWPDDSLHWIEAKGTVERNAQGEAQRFVGVNIDITERKELELRLERSNSELAEYAAVVSHDLQAPLRTIASYLDVLEARYAKLFDKDALRYFSYITTSTKRMNSLIRGILEYSKVGAEAAPQEDTDCNEVFKAAVGNLDEAIRDTNAEVSAAPLPVVSANQVNLTRLFQNLIGNAIKFCQQRPIVNISAKRLDNEWVFSISDNGPGIEKEHCDRIFMLFQRLTTEAQVPGSGIGLATCKKIVERHGGRIWVQSTVGSGAVFFFTIPG